MNMIANIEGQRIITKKQRNYHELYICESRSIALDWLIACIEQDIHKTSKGVHTPQSII